MPQSMQVAKSIQYQSVPFEFLAGPGWMQATGQASTQSAMPSQVFVTMVCDTVFLLPKGVDDGLFRAFQCKDNDE